MLRSCGLARVGMVDGNRAYGLSLRVSDELLPIFVPSLQSVRGTKILSGVIGVARKEATGKSDQYNPVISVHTMNFPDLASLFEFGVDKSHDASWVHRVVDLLRILPTNQNIISDMVERRASIGGVSILDMVHQNQV